MRVVLIAAALFFIAAENVGAQEGTNYLVFTTNSYHFNRDTAYNETNHGLGFERDFHNDFKAHWGFYENSFYRRTAYIGGSYVPWTVHFGGWCSPWCSFRLGGTLVLASGYEEEVVPIIAPLIAWEPKGFPIHLNFTYVPTVVIANQVKVPFD